MLTMEAQRALKQIIDIFPNVIFIATADNITDILPCLLSRFLLFRLSRPSVDSIIAFISRIIIREDMSISYEVLKYIVEALDNDMRRIINFLQSIHVSRKTITSIDHVKKLLGYNIKEIRELLDLILAKNTEKAIKKSRELINNGYTAYDILLLIFEIIQQEIREQTPKYALRILKLLNKYIPMSMRGIPDNPLICNFIVECITNT